MITSASHKLKIVNSLADVMDDGDLYLNINPNAESKNLAKKRKRAVESPATTLATIPAAAPAAALTAVAAAAPAAATAPHTTAV